MNECGHDTHETVLTHVRLGRSPYHDFASHPEPIEFDIEVFDYPRYVRNDKIFCQGQDGFAAGVLEQNVWESYETRLAAAIFKDALPGRSLVVDVGCHVGWYSLLAASFGHVVDAYDAEADTCVVARRNASRMERDLIRVHHERIDAQSPKHHHEDVLLLKADVEGAEHEVVEAWSPCFERGSIKWALLEISPCFRSGYDELLDRLMRTWSYDAWQVPDKSCGPAFLEAYSEDPLGTALTPELRILNASDYVRGIRQQNVILRRRPW